MVLLGASLLGRVSSNRYFSIKDVRKNVHKLMPPDSLFILLYKYKNKIYNL
jgi:hypothetical protein